MNLPRKDFASAEVRVVFIYPDVYEVGMASHGIKILYETVNRLKWASAERAFAPWPDVEAKLRAKGISLCSLETKTPIGDFDVIGFSLAHELLLTNVLAVLSLSNIEPLAEHRDSPFPLVIAGGEATSNPAPLARFFDAIFIGEGDAAIVEILEVIREAKRNCASKEGILSALSQVEGIYVPMFPKKTKRRIFWEFGERSGSREPRIVPTIPTVHDRFVVEVMRGCGNSCRFCHAGWVTRPPRWRKPEDVVKEALEGIRATGYREIGLLSLSTGDYPHLEYVLKKLRRALPPTVTISLPSLRVDTFCVELANLVAGSRKPTFTFAPEAGTDRLRVVLNKMITNDDIMRVVDKLLDSGWRLLKFYFMIGLPTERDEDVEAIGKLLLNIAKLGHRKRTAGMRIHASVSPFVPKPHTPFQWVGQAPIGELRDKFLKILGLIKKEKAIKLSFHRPEMSLLEAAFARGDERLGEVALLAFKRGARFDSWDETFNFEAWTKAFEKMGISPESVAAARYSLDDKLPWDVIDTGVSKGFLFKDYIRALRGEEGIKCNPPFCRVCGVCQSRTTAA